MVDSLSEEQTNEFRDIYDKYLNEDNVILAKDLGTVMRSLGKNPSEAEV